MLNARHKKPAFGSAAASIVIVLHNPVFGVHIGTTVINTVQRDAESQLIVEVVHRGKVESRHGVTARRSYLLPAFYVHTFPSPRAEQHKVVTDMTGKTGNIRLDQRLGQVGFFTVEVVHQTDFRSGGVHSCVGEFGVAVGEMRKISADDKIEITGKRPIEVDTCIEIRIHP